MKMSAKNRKVILLALCSIFLLFHGCYEFDFVHQPGSGELNSYVVVQIRITTNDGDSSCYTPYFGILLPVGWLANDSILFTSVNSDGIFIYSDSLVQAMNSIDPPPSGYYWQVYAGKEPVLYVSGDSYDFAPVIRTGSQKGTYYLDYMAGSSSQNYGGLNFQRSNDHMITIGLPKNITVTSPANDGPGSLREAIDNIDFYGTITFDPDQNDTIKLTEQLVVNKECRINGPVNNSLVISGNNVTGIFHISSSPVISNLLLTKGCTERGSAIYCERSSPVLKDIVIKGNTALAGSNSSWASGGGIYCEYASPVFENVTICDNSSSWAGGGIYFEGKCRPMFDSINRSSIYMNHAELGNDLYISTILNYDTLKIVLDTFTVLHPTSFHASPVSRFDFDILHGKYQQTNSDLYVSPAGNNSNNGLSAETPLKSIYMACIKMLADSLNPRTIHLSDGVYGPTLNEDFFPVRLPGYVNLSGDSASSTILDAEGLSPVVLLNSCGTNRLSGLCLRHGSPGLKCYNSENMIVHLGNMSITDNLGIGFTCSGNRNVPESMNVFIDNVTIADNHGDAVFCEYSNMRIFNCTIRENNGGGLIFHESKPFIENVWINGNKKMGINFVGRCDAALHNVSISENFGCGISSWGDGNQSCSINLNQVMIRDNTGEKGGGIFCRDSFYNMSDVTIVNNTATVQGGGIFYWIGNNINFDTLNRCNIHSNRAFQGNDFYGSPGHIVVDTFSVLNPTEFHVYQAGNTTYDILHGKYAQSDSDLFVSPSGDNNNSGLSPDEPLKNIHCAMSKMLPAQPQTIRLLDGVYSPSGNNEFFPVRMYNKINLSGVSKATVIIDAEQTGGVIHVKNITSPWLSDMTITGGEASSGGGIECQSSSLTLKNLLITGNNAEYSGGGLVALFCNPVIENCDFISNSAGNFGGGLSFVQSKPVMQNVRVSYNYTERSGGGIYCQEESQLTMKNVSIFRNTAMERGGGIFNNFGNSKLFFDETDRCDIYLNRAAEGGDICLSGAAHVVVDTFTVMNPMKFHASPRENFTFDIQNSLFEQANADLYVKPSGDNSRSGLSETEALKDIYVAATKIITDSTNPKSIHLLEGTYSSSSNTELFPIYLPDYSSLKGESSGKTVLDAEEQNTVVRLLEKSDILLSGMTIKGGSGLLGGGIGCEGSNLSLQDIVISDNVAWRGSGIYSSHSILSIRDVQVIKNTSRNWNGNSPETPGIYMILSDAVIENSVIAENEAPGFIVYPTGIGLDCLYSGLILRNSSVTGNTSKEYGSYEPYWPAGISFYESKPVIINSIIFSNYPKEIHFERHEPDTITVSYSDIRGGMGGIFLSGDSSYVNWLEGNIDQYPLFTGSGVYPFSLKRESPCINAGTPDTTGMNLPMTDITGNPRIFNERIDMGAYEWNNVSIDELRMTNDELNISASPNPFFDKTTFAYSVRESCRVRLEIFDFSGLMIAMPLNGFQQAGKNTVYWNAAGLPAGIYLYRLQAGDRVLGGKVVKQ